MFFSAHAQRRDSLRLLDGLLRPLLLPIFLFFFLSYFVYDVLLRSTATHCFANDVNIRNRATHLVSGCISRTVNSVVETRRYTSALIQQVMTLARGVGGKCRDPRSGKLPAERAPRLPELRIGRADLALPGITNEESSSRASFLETFQEGKTRSSSIWKKSRTSPSVSKSAQRRKLI